MTEEGQNLGTSWVPIHYIILVLYQCTFTVKHSHFMQLYHKEGQILINISFFSMHCTLIRK